MKGLGQTPLQRVTDDLRELREQLESYQGAYDQPLAMSGGHLFTLVNAISVIGATVSRLTSENTEMARYLVSNYEDHPGLNAAGEVVCNTPWPPDAGCPHPVGMCGRCNPPVKTCIEVPMPEEGPGWWLCDKCLTALGPLSSKTHVCP